MSSFRLTLPVLAIAMLAALSLPASASAFLLGVESNSELVNSTVTRSEQAATLEKMRLQGVRIVRANINWNEVATSTCSGLAAETLRNHENGCYDWRIFDGVVQESSSRGIQVLVSVSRAPSWLHGNSDPYYLGASSAQWTRSVEQYEAFMYAAASRYTAGSVNGTVRLWTVWNEPNSKTYFKPMDTAILMSAAPKRYAQLFARTAVAIRAANPSAIVALGPTGPQSTIKPATYIRAVQAALPTFLPGTGAAEKSLVGAWAHNPYPGVNTAPSRGTAKLPVIGMTNVRELFKALDAAPITRGVKVWATEFAYQTNPPDEVLGISPALQARYMAESFDWLESTGRVTVGIWYGFTDGNLDTDWQGGTHYFGGTRKPSYAWYQRPVSVPIGATRVGAYVRVWARSSVNSTKTRIAMSTNGRSWVLLPAVGRKADGTTTLLKRVTRTTYFATWDGTRGPARVVLVR